MTGVAIAVTAAGPVDHARGDRDPAGRPRSCDVAAVRLPAPRIPFGDFGWFGTKAQLAGLVTVGLPLATLVVWARLLLLDREQDEMAADLGAPPGGVVWRVLLPQLAPAIGAAAAVVFAGALGEFVIVQALVGTNETRALGPALLGARQGPEPRFSAIGAVLAITGGPRTCCSRSRSVPPPAAREHSPNPSDSRRGGPETQGDWAAGSPRRTASRPSRA